MARTTARSAARAAEQDALTHAATTAQDEIAATEAALENAEPAEALPADIDPDRIVIGLGALTELLQDMRHPADVLGADMVARLKHSGGLLWKASLEMSAFDLERRSLAYEWDGKVIVRTMGRFLQSQARTMLTQAYYALRQAHREYKRWEFLDRTLREARAVDFQRTRPGQDDAMEAPWIDGDDRFDPTRKQGDIAAEALMEALPFVSAAFIFCGKVPGMTDGEPVTARVKKAQPTKPAERPQTMSDRMRAARPAQSLGEFVPAVAAE